MVARSGDRWVAVDELPTSAPMPTPKTQARDTSLSAERRQFEIWAAMTPAAKFRAFEQLMEMADAVAEAGIR